MSKLVLCFLAVSWVVAANAAPLTTASESACDVVRPHLPKECRCTEPTPLSFVAECDVNLDIKPLKFNDTIGVKFSVEPCSNPASISLDITEKEHGIDFPITGITAGTEQNIPIPGISIAIPKIGNLGLDAAVLIDGNPDQLTLKVGLNACVKVGKKTECASNIPILDDFLPIYLLSGSYSFGHICNSSGVTVRKTERVMTTLMPEFVQHAAASGSHYEDPKPNGCLADELDIQIQGLAGDFCTPKCTGVFKTKCPTDVPAGITAKPQCALQDESGEKYCALMCSPSNNEKSLRAGDAQCGKASCKPLQSVGVCTYDD